MDHTQKLPNEILFEIFGWLPDRDIVNVTSTCRRYWYIGYKLRKDSAYNLWNSKTVKFWDIPDEVIPLEDSNEKYIIEISKGKRRAALKYLLDKQFDIRRGDLIRFPWINHKNGNDGVGIYNGTEIIELGSSLNQYEYGYLPQEFKVIDEFPIGYFYLNFKGEGESNGGYEYITHSYIIWLDYKPYLPEILENITIGKHPDIKTKNDIDIIFTYFTHRNGRKYYIIACGREEYYKFKRISGKGYDLLRKKAKRLMIQDLLKTETTYFLAYHNFPKIECKDLEILYLEYIYDNENDLRPYK